MMQYSETCMFYLRGACRFGSRCWNSHDLLRRSPKTQALTPAATESDIEESTSTSTITGPSTSTNAITSTSTSASTSIDTSTSTSGISTQVQADQELQLHIEASMKSILKPSDDSEIEIEKLATDLSVAMKTGNGKRVKETPSILPALHQKKKKESSGNDNSVWNDIIHCAIDNDLQCNICFEIFIKPTVLNCSHTFCESCINVWTHRVKKCPICRVLIKSRSYCLTLDSIIEKIVEQLPKEIKHKRELAIKDRIKLEIYKPRSNSNRLSSGIDLAALLNLDGLMDDSPLQFFESSDEDDDIDEDLIIEEAEMFRRNLHDTVVNTRGVNPLMSYVVGAEEQNSSGIITRPRNSYAPQ